MLDVEVVVVAACTFVMSRADGGGGVPTALEPLTTPAQPARHRLDNAARIAATACGRRLPRRARTLEETLWLAISPFPTNLASDEGGQPNAFPWRHQTSQDGLVMQLDGSR